MGHHLARRREYPQQNGSARSMNAAGESAAGRPQPAPPGDLRCGEKLLSPLRTAPDRQAAAVHRGPTGECPCVGRAISWARRACLLQPRRLMDIQRRILPASLLLAIAATPALLSCQTGATAAAARLGFSAQRLA